MKKLLITGGNGDLAKSITQHFREKGFHVFSPSKDELDVSSKEQLTHYFETYGFFDCVIANAGKTIDRNPLKLSETDWADVIDINFRGAMWTAELAKKNTPSSFPLSIFYIGSYASLNPSKGQWNYASAKALLIDLTKEQAIRWGKEHTRVNLILPGFLETKMTTKLSQEIINHTKQLHTLNRFNTPEHVAQFIAFIEENMPHTSGQVFNLDSRIIP